MWLVFWLCIVKESGRDLSDRLEVNWKVIIPSIHSYLMEVLDAEVQDWTLSLW